MTFFNKVQITAYQLEVLKLLEEKIEMLIISPLIYLINNRTNLIIVIMQIIRWLGVKNHFGI